MRRKGAPGHQERTTTATTSQKHTTTRDTTTPTAGIYYTERVLALLSSRHSLWQTSMSTFSSDACRKLTESRIRIYLPPNVIRIKFENEKEPKSKKNHQPPRPHAFESDNEYPAHTLLLGTRFASQWLKTLRRIRSAQSRTGRRRKVGPENSSSKTIRQKRISTKIVGLSSIGYQR